MASITTADFKNGVCLQHNHDIFMIVEFQHVKPGKGNAFVRTKLKSMTTGRVLDHTFPSGTRCEAIRVERRQYQYLYKEADTYYFMNNETFDQVGINEKLINNPGLLQEGLVCELSFNADNETALTCDLPGTVILEITYTENGLKGDTATNTLKAATVETGAEIRVPLFVNQGDKVKINTIDNSYIERAK